MNFGRDVLLASVHVFGLFGTAKEIKSLALFPRTQHFMLSLANFMSILNIT